MRRVGGFACVLLFSFLMMVVCPSSGSADRRQLSGPEPRGCDT